MARKRKYKIGDFVKIDWLDASGNVNEDPETAHVEKAWNFGVLFYEDDFVYRLRHGRYYTDPKCQDFTTIPKSWTDTITVIMTKKEIEEFCS